MQAGPPACALWGEGELAEPADFAAVCNPEGIDLQTVEGQMHALINADRVQHATEANGAAPVEFDCEVAQVARRHAYEMCKAADLSHRIGGLSGQDRLAAWAGLELGDEIALWAENITWHFDLLEAERDFVENEPACSQTAGGHRLNILNRDLTHVGVGYCDCAGDEFGNFYLTQLFVTYDRAQVTGSNPFCGF